MEFDRANLSSWKTSRRFHNASVKCSKSVYVGREKQANRTDNAIHKNQKRPNEALKSLLKVCCLSVRLVEGNNGSFIILLHESSL